MSSHDVIDLVDDDGVTKSSSPSASSSRSNRKPRTSTLLQQIDLTDDIAVSKPRDRARAAAAAAAEVEAEAVSSTSRASGASLLPPAATLESEKSPPSSSVCAGGIETRPIGSPVNTAFSSSSSRRARLVKCAACLREDVRRSETFCLEACNHQLCAACVAHKICRVPSSSAPCAATPAANGKVLDAAVDYSARDSSSPVCPICAARVSVRDLALVLQEKAWDALKARRLAAFRARVNDAIRCPGCLAWVDVQSSDFTVGPSKRRTARSGSGGSCSGVSGTARERAEALLSASAIACRSCRTKACRFCGARVDGRKTNTNAACGPCVDSKLWAAAGLLDLLEELVANPSDVGLTGPVGPIKASSAVTTGKGRGGSGPSSRGGRGRGRGGRGWASRGGGRGGWGWTSQAWEGGWAGGGGGGGSKGISSKWSKGTGYGGAGDEVAAGKALAVAQDAEERADRAMAIVVNAFTRCLPQAGGESPRYIPELVALVRESSLLQTVCSYLRNDSLMDIAQRSELYLSLFKLVKIFAQHELLAPLIDSVPPKRRPSDNGRSCSSTVSPTHTATFTGTGSDSKGKGKGKAPAESSGSRATATLAEALLGSGANGDGYGNNGDEVVLEAEKVAGVEDADAEEEEEEEEGEEEEDVSVADLLASANRQAKVYAQAPRTGVGTGGAAAATLEFALQVTEVHDKVKGNLSELRRLAELRASTPAISAIMKATGTGGVAGAGLGRKRKREELDCVEVSLESQYLLELGDSRFELVRLLGRGVSHHFASQVSKPGGAVGGRARAVRISQEVSSLAGSLPVQPDSSIFLRVDEDRFDVMRAMITGPKDTPYEGGCFEFDILLPPDYPNRPPQVHFLTTGGGRVRMNPNLYNSGKVCLSLLGTWSGPGWDAKNSTLLQVLVSIQSLIFVAEPYFNEPGFEGQLGTSQGMLSSRNYNSRIRNATLMFGVVGALEDKSGPMRDVICKHFRLIKGRILQTAKTWLVESMMPDSDPAGALRYGVVDGGCNGDYATMKKTVNKVEALVAAL